MEDLFRPPSILRLSGISLKDYVSVEDDADARLLDGSADPLEPAPESAFPLDKIPRTFTGLDDWPLSTNLRCWSCGFTFSDRPKFVPTYIREGVDGSFEAGVLGNFCTFNCAELLVETRWGGRARNDGLWRAQDNLCTIYFIFTGRRVSHIKAAFCKTRLRQYGGEWEEETFWKKMRELDPVAGLRDHTLGSVVPERERLRLALESVKIAGAVVLTTTRSSVWGVCGAVPPPAGDSVALESGLPPGPPAALADGPPAARADDDLEGLLAGLLAHDEIPEPGPVCTRAEGPAPAPAEAPAEAPAPAPAEAPAEAPAPGTAEPDTDLDWLLEELGIQ